MKPLKIILIGYGRMGHEIEKAAVKRGHEIVSQIDKDNQDKLNPEHLQKADVAIEFSVPDAAYDNIMACFKAGLPVVSGTTGWLDKYYDVRRYCLENDNAFFYASNFSIGVNLFFQLNKQLAKIMDSYTNYNVSIEEIHHKHKLDAPSGTAVTLAEMIIKEMNRKQKWTKDDNPEDEEIGVHSVRENEVPGIHQVFYESEFDQIEVKHSAKSREGFSLGAVMAAEFLEDKKGIYTMDDLLNL
jgi:4-hydroxy-tetrahydrodipicolinate reductase